MDGPRPLILLADDDSDDRLLAQDALSEVGRDCELRTVTDGVELMDYLLHRGAYGDERESPRPSMILLDLNMPRMDGREALVHIRTHEALRHIPVVVLTTSKSEEDVFASYAMGGNSFITKPVSFAALVELLREFLRYWLDVVELPPSVPEAGMAGQWS
jgi:CheY-like chemotaxis protein